MLLFLFFVIQNLEPLAALIEYKQIGHFEWIIMYKCNCCSAAYDLKIEGFTPLSDENVLIFNFVSGTS